MEARPAYQRMLAKARPDGLIGSPPALPARAAL
jgi:glutathione S-transferase